MAELGRSGRRAEVLDVAHQQADVSVSDLLDRHRQGGAVPHVARDAGKELLGGRSISSISRDGSPRIAGQAQFYREGAVRATGGGRWRGPAGRPEVRAIR